MVDIAQDGWVPRYASNFVYNGPPELSILDQVIRLDLYPWRRLDAVLEAFDPEGDEIAAYELWDSDGAASWWADGGTVDASAGYVTTDLAGTWFTRDGTASSQVLYVRASDGISWGEWEAFVLISQPGPNAAPVLSVERQTIALDRYPWVRLDAVLGISDADGDAMALFEIWDADGGPSWWADGGVVDASSGYATADLAGIWFTRDAAQSSQTLWVRANDGTAWGEWTSFVLDTVPPQPNAPPLLYVPDQTIYLTSYPWVPLAPLLSVADADGDAVVSIEIWDAQGPDSWWADGAVRPASSGYVTSDVSDIWFRRDDATSSQTLWLRAFDGEDWGAWEGFALVTTPPPPNDAPVCVMEDVTVTGTGAEGYVTLNALIEITDADSDEIAAIEIFDAAGLDNFYVEGAGQVDASTGYVVSDPSTIVWIDGDRRVSASSPQSVQELWVRASDGIEWGAWTSFELISL